MTAALIILFVVAVALVPLVQFMPSQRQRAIAGLREHAAINGLFVEFRELPGRPEFRKQAGVTPGTVIYYGRRLPASTKDPRPSVQWQTHNGNWQPVGERRAVPAFSEPLPASVLAAGFDEASCGVYWVESDSTADVEVICRVLEEWSQSLIQ